MSVSIIKRRKNVSLLLARVLYVETVVDDWERFGKEGQELLGEGSDGGLVGFLGGFLGICEGGDGAEVVGDDRMEALGVIGGLKVGEERGFGWRRH